MDFKSNISPIKRVWLSFGKLVLLSLFIFSFLLHPAITYAGFWSSVAGLFSGQNASAQTEVTIESSSQNIPLPEPATNFNTSIKTVPEIVIDGGDALLPETGPSAEAPDKIDNSTGQVSTYIVRSGDTLAEIAEMFDVSANTIMWANDLSKSSTIKIGQTLVILPISGVMHTVVSGDTLSTIAKKYGGDVTEISDFNDIKVTAKLSIGDTILIPDGDASSSIKSSAKTPVAYSTPSYSGYYIAPWGNASRARKTQGLHGYRNSAVDYGMPVGTPLIASAAGTVIISKNSGWNGGYGNYVIIKHPNGTQTIYGHMANTIVSVGQKVSQGQAIGYSGNSGNSTGPHLHFEIRGAKNPF